MTLTATRVRNFCLWGAGFLIPIALLCLVSKLCNVYPFGTISFLTEDLLYQYVDFFAWFQRVLSGDASIFYSASQALGTNTWGLYSYYLASPFNFLVVFFDQEHLTDFAFLITALKLGFIQIATMFFLRKRFGLSLGLSLVLALGFTCSSWTASQLRNPLWLDALILLPLLAHSAHTFIVDGHWKMFTALLVVAIITCWYTAYILILFLALYLFFEFYLAYCKEPTRFTKQQLGKSILHFIGILALTLLLTAWTFVPTVLSMMGDTSTTIIGVEQTSLFTTISHHLPLVLAVGVVGVFFLVGFIALIRTKRLQPKTKLIISALVALIIAACVVLLRAKLHPALLYTDLTSIVAGFIPGTWSPTTPQLFGTTLLTVLSIACLFYKKINLRVRIASLLLLVFLIMSTFTSPLYFVWCGMRWPNGFYCRMSFLAIFIMLWIAALFVQQLTQSSQQSERAKHAAHYQTLFVFKTPYKTILIATILFSLFIFALNLIGLGSGGLEAIVAPLLSLLIGVGILLYFYAKTKQVALFKTNLCLLLVGLLVFAEVSCSFVAVWKHLYTGYLQESEIAYVQASEQQWDALKEQDSNTFRFAKTYRRAIAVFNEGMTQGFNELSSYSSAHNGNAIKFLNELGYSREGEFSTAYQQPLLSADALLGVKYIASKNKPAGCETTTLQDIYSNPYALSLGYGISPQAAKDALSLTFQKTTNPFERQNKLYSALLGRDIEIYKPCVYHIESQVVDEANDIQEETYAVTTPNNTFTYGYVVTHSAVPCFVTINATSGEFTSTPPAVFQENERFNQNIFCLNPSTTPEPTVTPSNYLSDTSVKTSDYTVILQKDPTYAEVSHNELTQNPNKHAMGCVFYTLDWDVFTSAINELKEQPVTFDSFKDGYIEGTINADASKDVLLSIPYDKGWTVLLDETAVQPSPVLDGALTLIPIKEGAHSLEMHYISPGFIPGCAISGLTVVVLIFCAVRSRRHKRLS